MQPHEGPPTDPERERQRRLTMHLTAVIVALTGILISVLVRRFG